MTDDFGKRPSHQAPNGQSHGVWNGNGIKKRTMGVLHWVQDWYCLLAVQTKSQTTLVANFINDSVLIKALGRPCLLSHVRKLEITWSQTNA